MKYSIVDYPISEELLKSGAIAQTNITARVNNSKTKCIVSYNDIYISSFRKIAALTLEELNDYMSKCPEEWDALFIEPKTVINLAEKTTEQNIPKVAVYKAEGSGSTKVSHDWTDPTTWYMKSNRVNAETPTLESDLVYELANKNVIDLTHGRLYSEDDFASEYRINVYENAVLQTEGEDYTVNYEDGKIMFTDEPAVPVTVDYSYASDSCWILAPNAGKKLYLEHAELNLSKDIVMNSAVSFEIWVHDPYDLPNKVMHKRIAYKSIKDIINAANLGQGYIPACGGLENDILIFPFNYLTLQTLKSSVGAELRVKVDSDTPFSGEWATATFYVMSEAE